MWGRYLVALQEKSGLYTDTLLGYYKREKRCDLTRFYRTDSDLSKGQMPPQLCKMGSLDGVHVYTYRELSSDLSAVHLLNNTCGLTTRTNNSLYTNPLKWKQTFITSIWKGGHSFPDFLIEGTGNLWGPWENEGDCSVLTGVLCEDGASQSATLKLFWMLSGPLVLKIHELLKVTYISVLMYV